MKLLNLILVGLFSSLTALAATEDDDTSDTAIVSSESTEATDTVTEPTTLLTSTLQPAATKAAAPPPNYGEPWDTMAAQCRPVGQGKPIKSCLGGPIYYGTFDKIILTCPHWAYIPRFLNKALHMNMERYHRNSPTGKWEMVTNLQAARYTWGPQECGYLRDQKEGKVLFDGCRSSFYPEIAEIMAKPMLEKGFKPLIEGMGWHYADQLREVWIRFMNARDCINLSRVMKVEA